MTRADDPERAVTELARSTDGPHAPDSFDKLLQEVAHVPRVNQEPFVAGTLVAGKLRIERRIGEGGMGAVYAVIHELTRHRRALKLLHPQHGRDAEIVQRFFDEASAAGRAPSPHLVETHDAGFLPSGEPYLVMEYLEGESLRGLLVREGRLRPTLAAELVAQACEGVAAAHAAGIIHRDLKPDNLFVVERAGRPHVKVLDFGLSKFTRASMAHAGRHATQAGAIFGTPAYMAPEQLRSAHDVDARADIFALGAVLFECLGGEAPFEAPTLHAIIARVVSGQHTRLEQLRPELDPAMIALVHRAIAVDPDARFGSAAELGAALSPYRTNLDAASALRVHEVPVTHGSAGPAIPTMPIAGWRASRWLLGGCGLGLVAVLVAGYGGGAPSSAPAQPAPVAAPLAGPLAIPLAAPASTDSTIATEESPAVPPGTPDAGVSQRAARRARKPAPSRAPAATPTRSLIEEYGVIGENPYRGAP